MASVQITATLKSVLESGTYKTNKQGVNAFCELPAPTADMRRDALLMVGSVVDVLFRGQQGLPPAAELLDKMAGAAKRAPEDLWKAVIRFADAAAQSSILDKQPPLYLGIHTYDRTRVTPVDLLELAAKTLDINSQFSSGICPDASAPITAIFDPAMSSDGSWVASSSDSSDDESSDSGGSDAVSVVSDSSNRSGSSEESSSAADSVNMDDGKSSSGSGSASSESGSSVSSGNKRKHETQHKQESVKKSKEAQPKDKKPKDKKPKQDSVKKPKEKAVFRFVAANVLPQISKSPEKFADTAQQLHQYLNNMVDGLKPACAMFVRTSAATGNKVQLVEGRDDCYKVVIRVSGGADTVCSGLSKETAARLLAACNVMRLVPWMADLVQHVQREEPEFRPESLHLLAVDVKNLGLLRDQGSNKFVVLKSMTAKTTGARLSGVFKKGTEALKELTACDTEFPDIRP